VSGALTHCACVPFGRPHLGLWEDNINLYLTPFAMHSSRATFYFREYGHIIFECPSSIQSVTSQYSSYTTSTPYKPTCRPYKAEHQHTHKRKPSYKTTIQPGYQYTPSYQLYKPQLHIYLQHTKLLGLPNHSTSSHAKNTYYTNRRRQRRDSLTTHTHPVNTSTTPILLILLDLFDQHIVT
jgi:hypothetical protein